MPEHERMRPSAAEIYERVKQDAREELDRKPAGLGFSGLIAGATLGFSGIVLAAVQVALGARPSTNLIGSLFYPVAFLAVILGRAQFFTENTLYPVALVFDDRRYVSATLRIWVIVFVTNLIGALIFALVAVKTGAFPHGVGPEFARLGDKLASDPFVHNFWSAIMAGWLLALIAWLVEATEVAIGQAVVIWALGFLVGFLQLDHSVASTAEVFGATINGALNVGDTLWWLAAALLGNIVGGVGIVAILNYGQVRAGD
jgi:formate-nitrite transporter family protein